MRLRVRGRNGSRAEVQDRTERFLAETLETVGDLLEAKWPGRFFFLRSLQLRWKVADEELSDGSAVAAYAEEIADSFGDPPWQRPGEAAPEGGIVVFRDEASWWACYLAGFAIGNGAQRAWVYDALRSQGIRIGALAERGRFGQPAPALLG